MEHIFTTKSNAKKPLLKPLDINIKEQHCSVNKICFLVGYPHPKYYKYQVYNLHMHTLDTLQTIQSI